MRKSACIRIELAVEFDDDGDTSLEEQALDAAQDMIGLTATMNCGGMEVVGQIVDIEDAK